MLPVLPVRRALRAAREMPPEEVRALLPHGDERLLCCTLIRRAGEAAFDWLGEGQPARAGDELLLYAIDRRDLAVLDALNHDFDRAFYARRGPVQPDERALIAEQLPARGATLLEICCGAGRITTHLPRDGNRVVGLDLNLPSLRAARAEDGDRIAYLRGDALRLPFADRRFDRGLCLENSLGVLFSRAPLALAELIRVTRSGGAVWLGLREQAGPPDRFHVYANDRGLVNVVQTFDAPSVEELLAALPAASSERIASRRRIPGAARPWGGETFYLELTLE